MKSLTRIMQVHSAEITVSTRYDAVPNPRKKSGFDLLEGFSSGESAVVTGVVKGHLTSDPITFLRKRWRIVRIEHEKPLRFIGQFRSTVHLRREIST